MQTAKWIKKDGGCNCLQITHQGCKVNFAFNHTVQFQPLHLGVFAIFIKLELSASLKSLTCGHKVSENQFKQKQFFPFKS